MQASGDLEEADVGPGEGVCGEVLASPALHASKQSLQILKMDDAGHYK